MTKAKPTTNVAADATVAETGASATVPSVKRPRGSAMKRGKPTGATSTMAASRAIPNSSSIPIQKLPRQTKAALLRARLSAPGGASLAALMEATGWQAHTLRACLSGLRKEGLTLTRRREGLDTIYAIEPDACGLTADPASTTVPAEATA